MCWGFFWGGGVWAPPTHFFFLAFSGPGKRARALHGWREKGRKKKGKPFHARRWRKKGEEEEEEEEGEDSLPLSLRQWRLKRRPERKWKRRRRRRKEALSLSLSLFPLSVMPYWAALKP